MPKKKDIEKERPPKPSTKLFSFTTPIITLAQVAQEKPQEDPQVDDKTK